jgi:hypothetical protein
MAGVLAWVLLACCATSVAAAGEVSFKDDFAGGKLDPKHYVDHGEGFRAEDGVLRGRAAAGRRPLLNLLPCLGRNASLAVDYRWAGGTHGSLLVLCDWRYRFCGPFAGALVQGHLGKVTLIGVAGAPSAEVKIEKGAWTAVQVVRAGDEVAVSIAGKEVLRAPLPAKEGIYAAAEEAKYGGFGLALAEEPGEQVVELDNLVVGGERSPVEWGSETVAFSVEGVEHTFAVLHERGFDDWASGQAEVSAPYVKRCAELFGAPPEQRRLGMVQSRGKYFDSGYGFNNHGVVYQVALPKESRTISRHELGHVFSYLHGKRWSIEGFADLCVYADIERVFRIPLTVASMHADGDARERLKASPADLAMALDDDRFMTYDGMPTSEFQRAGWKARVFCVVLWRLLGAEAFREVHRRAAKLGHPMSSQELKAIAEEVRGRDLTPLFAGWVFPGKPALRMADILADKDGDGLSDLDERLYGTDAAKPDSDGDGHLDLAEIIAGYDPADASKPPAGVPVVDGVGRDWAEIQPAATDADEALGPIDVKSVRVLGDRTNRRLFVRVEYYRPPAKDDRSLRETYLTLDLSLSASKAIDYRVNLFPGTRGVNALRTRGAFTMGEPVEASKWKGVTLAALVAGGEVDGAGVVEASIPLDALGATGPLALYITAGGPTGADWVEASPVRVELTRDLPPAPDRPFGR